MELYSVCTGGSSFPDRRVYVGLNNLHAWRQVECGQRTGQRLENM